MVYLMKFPEEPLRKLLASGRDPRTIDDDEIAVRHGWLAKRPGDATWVNSKTDPDKFHEVTRPACPDGGRPEPVTPPGG